MNTMEKYTDWINFISQKINRARLHTHLYVNKEMLTLYWEIGTSILDVQERLGWGSKIIDKLSAAIKTQYPENKGYSVRNLKYMRRFAQAYPDFPVVQVPLAQNKDEFVQVPLAQITWYHHISLLSHTENSKERAFYISKTAENQWSRDVMLMQIKSKLFERQGKALNNFQETLPSGQSDLAKGIFKDPYKFDFLLLNERFQEHELEQELTDKITHFLLELGKGFAFVGKQVAIEIEDDTYRIDLLFYHTLLHSYVVVELKAGVFKPEYISKLNFYTSAVDDKIANKHDNATVGLLLCASKNNVKVEYAMRGINKPIGVAAYEIEEFIHKAIK